jgi:muramoyltetrapeptide carboxypeptidase
VKTDEGTPMKSPAPLQKGDLIYITAPAKAIESEHVFFAKKRLEDAGYKVLVSEHCLGQHHYFSGSDDERTRDLQYGIDHPEVKAILCARGGYGCVRIVDSIGWAGMLRHPKWLIGFSDVTVFHQKLQSLGVESIHGTMPLNFTENSEQALETLFHAIEGMNYSISSPSHTCNVKGKAEGTLLGGNLSILYSLLASDQKPDYRGSILFIEDLSEQLYHIDRIFHSLRKAGVLDQISGLIVGGMTEMKDTAIPFGKTLEEIILAHFQFKRIPICFEFPAGHIPDNRALILGRKVTLDVSENITTLYI